MSGTPQSGVVTDGRPCGVFLVIHLTGQNDKEVAAAVVDFPGLLESIAKDQKRPVEGAIGLSYSLCKKWESAIGSLPKELREQPTYLAEFSIPSTGGELFVHVKADKNDLCWEAAHEFILRLPKAAVKRIDETYAWEYKDSRDLSGFIDGSANPSGTIRTKAALIGSEDPQHQGGAYVLGQTWVHDLDKFRSMQLQAQEHTMGRRKENSAKIGDRPADSHVSRMEIDGVDMKIHRQSLPFGTAQRHGLAFVAYSSTLTKIDRMLRRMAGSEGPADRVMRFSTAVASSWWYVPSREVLAKLAPRSKM